MLLKGTGKQKGQYQLWNTNQKGVFKNSSGWKALDAAVSLNWEGIFGKDLNGDKVIEIVIPMVMALSMMSVLSNL